MITAIVLTDGVAGHERTSAGVLAALSRHREVTPVWLPMLERRPLSRRLHRVSAALREPRAWLARNVTFEAALPERADVVVSTGPSTAATNIALARALRARNIYCGFPKWPALGTTVILTPVPSKARNALLAPRPTDIDAADLPAPRSLAGTGPRQIALLVGGESKHYAYTEADMLTLARRLRAILDECPDWSLLAYDSRRTSQDLFDAFAAALGADGSRVRIVRFAEAGLASNAEAFGSDLVLVTADSLSMITEAVASARPTLVLSAPDYVGPKRDRQEIDALVTQNRVARADFDALDRRALLSPPAPPTQSQPAGLSALLEARGL